MVRDFFAEHGAALWQKVESRPNGPTIAKARTRLCFLTNVRADLHALG